MKNVEKCDKSNMLKNNIIIRKFKNIFLELNKLSTAKILVMGFLVMIFLGACVLKTDISLVENKTINFLDAIFIATSAVCVTGLSTVVISETFSLFGKCVLLFLIQIGAIGFMTFVCLGFEILGKKLSLKSKMLFEESFDLVTDDIKKLVKRILIFVFGTEITGAVLLSFSFVPQYGKVGIFYSLFHSISAFCNAGFDLFGSTSLLIYQTDWYVNVVLMILIVLGGIGYLVVFDILKKIKYTIINKHSFKHIFRKFNLHTKIVLVTTFSLIIFGTLIILILESLNPNTLANKEMNEKLLISLFQSISARTAGFNTLNMSECLQSTNLLYIVLMFIGGSPASTAGGIKTVTFAILVLTVVSMLKKKKNISIYNRKIAEDNLRKAIVVFFLAISTIFITSLIFMTYEKCTFLESIFEIVSAFGTVGSTLGVTNRLTNIGKILLIILMFIGRLGIVTVIMSTIQESHLDLKTYEYPEERMILG